MPIPIGISKENEKTNQRLINQPRQNNQGLHRKDKTNKRLLVWKTRDTTTSQDWNDQL